MSRQASFDVQPFSDTVWRQSGKLSTGNRVLRSPAPLNMTRGLMERPSALAHSTIDTQSVDPGSFMYVRLDPDFVTGPSTLPLLLLPCGRPCSSIFQILDGLIRCSQTTTFNRVKNPSRVDLS